MFLAIHETIKYLEGGQKWVDPSNGSVCAHRLLLKLKYLKQFCFRINTLYVIDSVTISYERKRVYEE